MGKAIEKENGKGKGKGMRLGALEAGGTKMVCAIVELENDEKWNILEKTSIPTTLPFSSQTRTRIISE